MLQTRLPWSSRGGAGNHAKLHQNRAIFSAFDHSNAHSGYTIAESTTVNYKLLSLYLFIAQVNLFRLLIIVMILNAVAADGFEYDGLSDDCLTQGYEASEAFLRIWRDILSYLKSLDQAIISLTMPMQRSTVQLCKLSLCQAVPGGL